jgi:hypothetical protein
LFRGCSRDGAATLGEVLEHFGGFVLDLGAAGRGERVQ